MTVNPNSDYNLRVFNKQIIQIATFQRHGKSKCCFNRIIHVESTKLMLLISEKWFSKTNAQIFLVTKFLGWIV